MRPMRFEFEKKHSGSPVEMDLRSLRLWGRTSWQTPAKVQAGDDENLATIAVHRELNSYYRVNIE